MIHRIFLLNLSFWLVMGFMAYIDRRTISTGATRIIIGAIVVSLGICVVTETIERIGKNKLKEHSTLRQPSFCFWPPDVNIPEPKEPLDMPVIAVKDRTPSYDTKMEMREWNRRVAVMR